MKYHRKSGDRKSAVKACLLMRCVWESQAVQEVVCGNTLGFILSEAGELRAESGSPRDFWLLVHCRGAKAKAGRPGIDGCNSPDQKRRKRHTVRFR